ncbi:uncharacterized protein PgNI_00279 [Pyricularia grisea]|uniref:Uncharacterized protein n=1 Tax=Pyricularia grisea TaxID=148305 RepID=A0A6P8BK64_PYRGI|nr:uncharacterized protein PgNI_00279 [Pyricularia grisea]TLD17281.1 hypothetical protein PgNI_00279 [Pyricularia grisea]
MRTTTSGLLTPSVARNGMGSGTTPTKTSSCTLWVAQPMTFLFLELIETLRYQRISPNDIIERDILIVWSGYIKQCESLPDDKVAELHELYKTQKPSNIGSNVT